MRILGIDPGTLKMGAGIIEPQGSSYKLIHFEVIKPGAKKAIAERLGFIHAALTEIIQKFRPEVLAIESVFFAKDIQATVKIGEARACAMLAASAAGIDVVEYAPARVKQAVSGNGRSTKDQVQRMVKILLNLKEMPAEDGADALAVAICHFHSSKHASFKKLLKAAV